VRNEDGVVIVPVFEEVLVVEKRLVLREEIRLRIAVSADPAEQTVSLRRQRVEVERLPAKDAAVMDAPEGTADSAPMDADATEVFLADRLSERR
jgi:stress response protein YsnF